MRIAMGGIVHETNTYAVESFGFTGLRSFTVSRGEEILHHAGARTFTGGMLAAIEADGHEVVPILHAFAQPSGTIEAAVYAELKSELVAGIAAALPVDAVVLDTHGAGIVEDIDDLEADLGAAIQTVIGADVPLITTLDLHGSITAEMGQVFDLMLGIYDYPHTDMYERGIEAIRSVPRLLSGEWKPTTHVERLPMLIPTSTTDHSPAKDIRQLCLDLSDESSGIRCSFFHGFPFTDIPAAGASVVVTTNDDPDLARTLAHQIAAQVWSGREDFKLESLSPEIAFGHAMRVVADKGGPVVVNDTADNTGGGAPGDATHVLRALLEHVAAAGGADVKTDPPTACFGFIFDPEVAHQAHAAGAGNLIDVQLGGKHDDVHGAPLALQMYVKATTDGSFIHTTRMLAGLQANYGPMARLQVGGPDGVDVLVGSKRSQVFDAEVFALHGIDVTGYDLVVLKSSSHFRAGFNNIATEIVTADSPGLTTLRVENFDHPRVDGPRWPIDLDVEWTPS